jgi:hypothetical protein
MIILYNSQRKRGEAEGMDDRRKTKYEMYMGDGMGRIDNDAEH